MDHDARFTCAGSVTTDLEWGCPLLATMACARCPARKHRAVTAARWTAKGLARPGEWHAGSHRVALIAATTRPAVANIVEVDLALGRVMTGKSDRCIRMRARKRSTSVIGTLLNHTS